MVKTVFTRIPGDIGNASTFNFPVRYKVVDIATPALMVAKPEETRSVLLPSFIDAAKDLEKEGVRAITTSCGFLALFQKEMANAVNIPVFTSSLMQVSFIHKMIAENKKVGVVTANSKALTREHLRSVGVADTVSVAIAGMEDEKDFSESIGGNLKRPLNPEKIESCMVSVSKRLAEEEDIGAIVFECTNMGPYSYAVQQSTGLPVFDIITLCNYVYHFVVRKRFEGFL